MIHDLVDGAVHLPLNQADFNSIGNDELPCDIATCSACGVGVAFGGYYEYVACLSAVGSHSQPVPFQTEPGRDYRLLHILCCPLPPPGG